MRLLTWTVLQFVTESALTTGVLATFETQCCSFGCCQKGQQNHTVTSQISCHVVTGNAWRELHHVKRPPPTILSQRGILHLDRENRGAWPHPLAHGTALLPRLVTEQPLNSTHLTKQHRAPLCWLQVTAHSTLPSMVPPVFRIQYIQTLTVNLLTPSSSPNFIQDMSAFFFPASISPAQICLIPAPLIKGTHSSHGHFVTNIMLLSSGFISRHL